MPSKAYESRCRDTAQEVHRVEALLGRQGHLWGVAFMALRDGRTRLGYQDHYLVDGGRARIILHAFVTPGDVGENQVLVDQLRRTLFRRKLYPDRLAADARYGTGTNIRAIEDLGIHAYIPIHEGRTASPFYRHADSVYD